MEVIINPIVDLLKTYAFQGGIAGIVIGAFLLFGLAYIYSNRPNRGEAKGIVKLFLILFASLGGIAIVSGIYGVADWKRISGSRLVDKPWAVQLETDNTIEDALTNKARFEQVFKDLVIVLVRDRDSGSPRFLVLNLYYTKIDADNGMETAHREWEYLKYGPEYKDSATTKDLKRLCKYFEASDDGEYFRCSNE